MSLDLHDEVEQLFRAKMVEFVEWSQANWLIDDKERAGDWFSDKSADYCDGYNAAVLSLMGAFECWNEEFGP